MILRGRLPAWAEIGLLPLINILLAFAVVAIIVRIVGVDRVRELYGAMTAEGASAAIMVCSGRYTPDATAFARDKPIELVAP